MRPQLAELSAQIYLHIIQLSGIEYAFCDDAGRITGHSQNISQVVALSEQPIVGQTVADLFVALAGLEESLAQVQQGQISYLQIDKIAHRFGDGREGYISLTIFPFAHELLLVIKDVTTESVLEQRLTQQRNELGLLAEQLAIARAQYEELLRRFVAESVAEAAMANPQAVRPGGYEQNVTVLFADIRGYTALSEIRSPGVIMEMLNRHFALIGNLIIAHGGAITHYGGDMIMALFNAPQEQANHPLQAVQVGLAIQRELQALHERAPDDQLYIAEFGIGINSGPAVIGYLGFQDRLEYTAIGETINVASRLSAVAQGGQVLIGPGTYQAISTTIQTRLIGPLYLKGKIAPVTTYEAVALQPQPNTHPAG